LTLIISYYKVSNTFKNDLDYLLLLQAENLERTLWFK
jgi:hypothetical protein